MVVFILVTTGLLGWALVKPYVTGWWEPGSRGAVGRYVPVYDGGGRTELPFANGDLAVGEPGGSRRNRTRETGASLSRQGGLNS